VSRPALVEEIQALGPWHLEVEVVPGMTTAVSREVDYPDELGEVTLWDFRRGFRALIHSVYPDLGEGRFSTAPATAAATSTG
jgi:hypothetical protein